MNPNDRTTVRTKAGIVEGAAREGLFVFKGIPYAAPPVGKLRWMPPEPPKSWEGVRPALEFGPIAPQVPPVGGIMGPAGSEPLDEDCLYLNVWTPGLDDGRRPVLVWIHGGVFNLGAGSMPSYDGSRLSVRGDVVVVTINYRLGMLGFLNLNEVTGGRIPATGNEGLFDQMAALGWVRDNIACFGGNPDNVTVFGESAGGMSIGCLLAMPATRGLFHKAILESGVGNTAIPLAAAVQVAEAFLELVKVKPEDAEALRSLPPEKLVQADVQLRCALAGPGQPPRHGVTAPVIDSSTLPVLPLQAIRSGSAAGIPLIIGTNLDEWRFFAAMDARMLEVKESDIPRRLQPYFPAEYAPGLLDAYRTARMKRGQGVSPMELVSAILSDAMFRMRALNVVEAQERLGSAVYNYLFTWKTEAMKGLLGACHLAEVGLIFGTHAAGFCGSGPDADAFSRSLQDAWAAFARTGDPSSPGVGTWPRYGKERVTMILDRKCRVEEAPYEEERRAWEKLPGAADR
jgi:para-nitrobenzyl esterase